MAILANAALKPPAHETAMVFCRVFLLFGELRVLLGSLRGSQRVAVPPDDVVPRVFLVLVFPVRLSVTDGDLNQFRHWWFPPCFGIASLPRAGRCPDRAWRISVHHAGCGASAVGQYEEHVAGGKPRRERFLTALPCSPARCPPPSRGTLPCSSDSHATAIRSEVFQCLGKRLVLPGSKVGN